MANPFDQFDAVESNPFDQFDGAQEPEFIGVGESEIDYTSKPEQDLSVGDVAQGVAETGRSFVEGAVFGTPAYMAGAVEGVIRSFVEEGFTPEDAARLANKSAAVFMTPPESQTGQNIAESIGDVADVLPPVFGGVAGQIPSLAQGVKGAALVAPEARGAVSAIKEAIPQAAERIKSDRELMMPRSVGAAGMDEAQRRQMAANQLPVPMQLTKGQATQDMLQQKFERETAKSEGGSDIRDRYNIQNEQFNANLDEFIDSTDTQFGDMSKVETGDVVTKALENQVKSEKKRISQAYEQADNSPEANEVVSLEPLGDYLNDNMASAGMDSIMLKVQKELTRLGVAQGDLNEGNLFVGDMTVKNAEGVRKFINKNTSDSDSNEQRVSSELKRVIDKSSEAAGGEPYKRARKAAH